MGKLFIGLALLIATACTTRARAPEYDINIPKYDLEAKRYEQRQRIAAETSPPSTDK